MWADQCSEDHDNIGRITTLTDADGPTINIQSLHLFSPARGAKDFKGPVKAWFSEIKDMKLAYVASWPSE
jgi:hypothetical protein